jgi:translation elongation factor EF-4
MTREQLKQFIKDTRGLVRGASVERKIKLLSLIKEAKRRCDEGEGVELDIESEPIPPQEHPIIPRDYLEEK